MFRNDIARLLILAAISTASPASATPPPPANTALVAATKAMDRFNSVIGDWVSTESYVDSDGIKTNNIIELRASRLEYIVYISIIYNGALDQFYTIKYDTSEKSYRIFLSGPSYMGSSSMYDVVDLSATDAGFSWIRPGLLNGKQDQSQSLSYSIALSGDRLTETQETPSWPPPSRIKRTYTFQRKLPPAK